MPLAGSSTRPSSWLDPAAIPVAVAEATWASLLVSLSVDGTPDRHADLPFLAFALPALVAALAVSAGVRIGHWRRRRLLILVPGAVVGAALSAGCIAALSAPHLFGRVALDPWTVTGHDDAVIAAGACVASALAWARGAWLGARQLPFRHVAISFGIGAVVFVALLASRSGGHSRFDRLTGDVGWLMVLFFPLMAAAAVLVREREYERSVLRRSVQGPAAGWLAVVGVPVVALVGVALLVAFAGSGAGAAGRAAGDLGSDIGHWIASLLRLIFGRSLPPVHPKVPKGSGSNATGSASDVPLLIVAAAVVLVLATAGVRAWDRGSTSAAGRPPRGSDGVGGWLRDSVFSWGHLLAQIWRAILRFLRSLFRPLRAGRGSQQGRTVAGYRSVPPSHPVRRAYWRVLMAAGGDRRRTRSETTAEFRSRLAANLDPDAAAALGRLTGAYDQVRYDAAPGVDVESDADEVVSALGRSGPPQGPPRSPQPERPGHWNRRSSASWSGR